MVEQETEQWASETIGFLRSELTAARAEIELYRKALNSIDALDPEDQINACSYDAARGLVTRMGLIARAVLEP